MEFAPYFYPSLLSDLIYEYNINIYFSKGNAQNTVYLINLYTIYSKQLTIV